MPPFLSAGKPEGLLPVKAAQCGVSLVSSYVVILLCKGLWAQKNIPGKEGLGCHRGASSRWTARDRSEMGRVGKGFWKRQAQEVWVNFRWFPDSKGPKREMGLWVSCHLMPLSGTVADFTLTLW